MPDAIDPFALFCAYHLGLDASGRARFAHLHDVARRFGVDPEQITEALERHGLSAARMLELDFDLAGARFDIEASPPGVDLMAIAHMHWEKFLAAPEKKRDWQAEAEQAARENERIFGGGKDGDQ
ncbi:MAG: hypothetical protein HYS27_25725 [Deltaproteobacteria bacterium]|nr:hypothetical protein [Deltaproteobacteria bacterium]